MLFQRLQAVAQLAGLLAGHIHEFEQLLLHHRTGSTRLRGDHGDHFIKAAARVGECLMGHLGPALLNLRQQFGEAFTEPFAHLG